MPLYTAQGYDPTTIKEYLEVTTATITSPNVLMGLQLPDSQLYVQALGRAAESAAAGSSTDRIMSSLKVEFKSIMDLTPDLERLYRSSLNYTVEEEQPQPPQPPGSTGDAKDRPRRAVIIAVATRKTTAGQGFWNAQPGAGRFESAS